MQLSIRDLELIRDACRVVGRQRRGHPVSEELKLLYSKLLVEHKIEITRGKEDAN
jgi:hypothetical protein